MKRSVIPALAAALLPSAAALAQHAAPYFQQGVDYRIEARLDEATSVLHGRERLRYTNHSRSTLDTVYVHQHLNAFRPNSAWARRDLEFGNRRFQDLGPNDYAYERFTGITVDGRPARAAYPIAPDSTVAAIPLPKRLAPGESTTLVMDWDARLSTLPRREGRNGRHYDWAQWYPRVAVYDRWGWEAHPLLPQGEFYGEYATYDVTLDLPRDQVIGATGVAVEGDPGYTVSPFEKGFYHVGPAEQLGLLTGAPEAGRKRVRYHAENVHHFAWSNDPRYVHEIVTRSETSDASPALRGLPTIHVLYLPEDTGWAHNAARRTYDAVTWLGGKMSPYPYPQLTNLHRFEGGGTEFPMMVMNGGPGEGLIVHETGHQWVHGILGNNEWKEGWLDEGFTSFLTNWYFEEKNHRTGNDTSDVWRGTMQLLERLERNDSTQPIAWPSERFRDFRTYNFMTYTKPSAVLRMLRWYLGTPVTERVLHEYARRFQYRHVTGEDLRHVAEEVSGKPLGWFWNEWIDTTAKLDYAVAEARARQLPGGRWATTVTVTRAGDAWMPVDLAVGGETRHLTSHLRRQTVVVETATKPAEAVLDPQWILIDYDRANNTAPVR